MRVEAVCRIFNLRSECLRLLECGGSLSELKKLLSDARNDLSTMSQFSETEESLLEILDKGISDESESFGVEFRIIIIILASNLDNERIIAGSQNFKHRPDIVANIPMNQNQVSIIQIYNQDKQSPDYIYISIVELSQPRPQRS